MATFLDKNEKRDLEILYHLYSEDRVWSAEELAKLAQCSLKSIVNSVASLNEVIAKYDLDCVIQSERHSGIHLIAESYESVYRLKTRYVQNTVTYQLMDTIFHGRRLSIEKLQQEFFLSRSTIYRKLSTIEKLVNENGFEFSKTELTITGSEASIREFFYLFYVSLTDDDYWPFPSVSYDYLEGKLAKIVKQASLTINNAEKLRLLYRMAVNAVRYQQKMYVTELPSNVQVAPNLEFNLDGAEELMLEGIPLQHKALEFRYLTLLYMTYANSVEVDETLEIEASISWHQSQGTKAYRLVDEFLKRMAEAYPEQEAKGAFSAPVLVYKLLSVAGYALLYPRLDVDLGISDRWNKRYQSLTYSSIERPKFTDVLWQLISTMHDEQPDELINPHHVFYFIYSVFSQTMNLKEFERPLTIKLVMEVGYLSESELKDKLYRLLPTNIEIVTSDTRFDEDVMYDLIISDLPHLVLDYPKSAYQYIWAFPPAQRDWQNIKQLIEMIQVSEMN